MTETCPYADFAPAGLSIEQLDATMREARDRDPVFYWPTMQAWVVTRHEDVMHLLHTPSVFSSRGVYDTVGWAPETRQFFTDAGRNPLGAQTFIVDMDPPQHTMMRRQINKVFTPKRVAEREGDVLEIANACIDSFPAGEPFDFVQLMSAPLQMSVIFRMLNIPDADVPQLARWSADIKKLISTAMPIEEQLRCAESTLAMDSYAGELIEARRENPTDDFFSDLVRQSGEGEITWTDRELRSLISPGLILAGFTTTKSVLTTAVHNFLTIPGLWEELCGDPAKVAAAIEESLRYSAPMFGFFRTTTQAVQLSGVTIPAESHIVWATFSANRDERRCPMPDQFLLDRPVGEQGHVSFGHGPHVCLGAGLARLTLKVAVQLLIERVPGLHIAPDFVPRYSTALVARELQDLLVVAP